MMNPLQFMKAMRNPQEFMKNIMNNNEIMQNPIIKKPEIIVFAGPNGSGKTTVTKLAKVIEPYINADEIKRTNYCSDLEAAQLAEKMREDCVAQNNSFTFETVLSTDRNLKLLQKAKEKGFFIRCIYVLTRNPDINVSANFTEPSA